MTADYVPLVCGVNARHYEVISAEEVCFGMGYMEPPEYGRCWGYYLAKNRADARRQAITTAEFEEWAAEMRASNKPPMAGLEVKPFVCPHGTCLGCYEEGKGCEACDFEAETGEPHEWTTALLEGPHIVSEVGQ